MNKSIWRKRAWALFPLYVAGVITSPAQIFTTMVMFNGTNGAGWGSLLQGADGNLYGTTVNGGANSWSPQRKKAHVLDPLWQIFEHPMPDEETGGREEG